MATRKENKDFVKFMQLSLLEDVIEWIKDNMNPEDVFDEDKLKEWSFRQHIIKSYYA